MTIPNLIFEHEIISILYLPVVFPVDILSFQTFLIFILRTRMFFNKSSSPSNNFLTSSAQSPVAKLCNRKCYIRQYIHFTCNVSHEKLFNDIKFNTEYKDSDILILKLFTKFCFVAFIGSPRLRTVRFTWTMLGWP